MSFSVLTYSHFALFSKLNTQLINIHLHWKESTVVFVITYWCVLLIILILDINK